MKTLLDKLAFVISFWCSYFFTWVEMRWHDVDVYLFSHQGNIFMAADAECRKYDCQRILDSMRVNWEKR